jgi:hypothetical protein
MLAQPAGKHPTEGATTMFLPESMFQYTWVLAPLVSIVLVYLAALIGNAIVFSSIIGNALVKVIVYASIFFGLKMSYLMYRVWPAYLKQTTTPSVTDFIVRRAPDVAPTVAVSVAFLFVVALIANTIARHDRTRNEWATVIVFAIAYAALIYGARTNVLVSTLVDTFF